MPDAMHGGADNYGVDHYRPRSKFPALATDYANLFYSCNPCNRRKGNYWPAERDRHHRFVPNPCAHEMSRHLKFVASTVKADTPAGDFTLHLLDLNDPDAIKQRETVITIIKTCAAQRASLVAASKDLRRLPHAATDKVQRAIAKIEFDIAEIDRVVARCMGEDL